MKKLMLCAGIAILSLTVSHAATVSKAAITSHIIIDKNDWMKSTDGTWPGLHDGTRVGYKLNTADASLWWSTDGKKWEAVASGMWQDKSGKWLKIADKKLMWSADGGKTWSEVPEWTWEDSDGNWQKFDSSWGLWTKKGGM